MAKKKEGPIQWDITTEEEWQDMLKKDGLWVVDVYRDWSGPCLCIQSMLKKIKTEIEDEILQFAMAPADKIEQLAPFRETCEPQWLFVAAGQFVAFAKGTNVVALVEMIKSEVVQERAVMNGKATRRLIKDLKSLTKAPKSLLDVQKDEILERKTFVTSVHKIREIAKTKLIAKELLGRSFTIAIIKPDAVHSGKTHEIMSELKEQGFRIVHQQERILTDDDVGEVYRLEKNYNYAVYGLARLMTHGPSLVLILVSSDLDDDVVERFRVLLGPANMFTAKRDNPTCLRAKYGSEGFNNGIHGSQNKSSAQRELNLFFPFVAEELSDETTLMLRPLSDIIEYALVIIRPHTVKSFGAEIVLNALDRANLQVLAQKIETFTPQMLTEFYVYTTPVKLRDCMLSGPCHLCVIQGTNLYAGLLTQIFGPDSAVEARRKFATSTLRAMYSKDDKSPSAFHVSESQETADKEVALFFPKLAMELQQIRNIQHKKSRIDIQRTYSKLTHLQQIVVIISPKTLQMHDVDDIINSFKDGRYNIYAQKYMTLTQDQANQFLKPYNDLYLYQRMVRELVTEPSLVMCVLCEDAVNRLKEFLGPWDPIRARRYAPKSLRSIYSTQEISPFYMTEKAETLQSDVRMFFPELVLKTSRLAVTVFPQHCLVLISPYMVQKFKRVHIEAIFEEDEIPVVLAKQMRFTQHMIEELYFIYRNDIIWNRTVKVLTDGEMLIIAVYMTDAVRQVNDGLKHGRIATLTVNDKDAVHLRASLDIGDARREMQIFFPRETIVTIIKPHAFFKYKEKILQMISNVGLLIVGQSVEILTEEQLMIFYAHASKTSFFNNLVQNMATGKVLILALNGHSAGLAWKKLAGPRDPDEAIISAPKSIRALFGKNIIENAVDVCHDSNILDKLYLPPTRRPPSMSVEAIGHAISIAASVVKA